MRISFAYDPAPHRCRRGVPVRDSVKALKADISTLVQITSDQANEIEGLRRTIGAIRRELLPVGIPGDRRLDTEIPDDQPVSLSFGWVRRLLVLAVT